VVALVSHHDLIVVVVSDYCLFFFMVGWCSAFLFTCWFVKQAEKAARRVVSEDEELRSAQRKKTQRIRAERESADTEREKTWKMREEGGFSSDSDMGHDTNVKAEQMLTAGGGTRASPKNTEKE
jgi:hypothetical protein